MMFKLVSSFSSSFFPRKKSRSSGEASLSNATWRKAERRATPKNSAAMVGVGNGVNGEWKCVIWNGSLEDSDSVQGCYSDEMSS